MAVKTSQMVEQLELLGCIQCGKCTGGCPVARKTTLNIRSLIYHMLVEPEMDVDAHPELMYWHGKGAGVILRPRLQGYDSPFGLQRTDAITLHRYGIATNFPSLPGNPLFDDTLSAYYYNAANPTGSVLVPETGTQIEVKSIRGNVMNVEVHRD